MADKLRKKYRFGKIFKRAMALFIIVIINFNSYAAVVSSNDGSAFITKAEFDALVNDFNSRIEDYEKSIDAKIDGAIAEYLAGLATASSYIVEDLIHVAKANSNNNLKFIRWKPPQATKDVDDVSAGFHCMWAWGCGDPSNATSGDTYGYITVSNHQSWAGSMTMRRYTNYTDVNADYTNSYYYANFPFSNADEVNYISTGNTTDFELSSLYRWRCHFDIVASRFNVTSAQNSVALADLDYAPTSITCDFTGELTKNGPGTINGPRVSVGSVVNTTPQMTITHLYSLTSSSDSTNNDFLNYNIVGTISGNAHFIDYTFRNNYNDQSQVNLEIQRTPPISDTTAYRGDNSGTAMQARNGSLTWAVATGKKGYGNNTSFKFKYNHQKIYNLNWANLVNGFYSIYFNESYYKYYGIPICKPNKMTGDITFKLKFTNTKIGDVYPAFTYQINDVKFSNGDLPSSGALYSETVPQGNSTYTKDIKITKDTVKDTTNGDYLYIKIQPSVANQIVSVDTEGDILITIEA